MRSEPSEVRVAGDGLDRVCTNRLGNNKAINKEVGEGLYGAFLSSEAERERNSQMSDISGHMFTVVSQLLSH